MGKISISKLKTLIGHKDCIYTLERTQYDHIFFSGAGDGMVVYWDLNEMDNGQLIAKLPNSIYGLHYLQELNILIVGHNYDGIHLLDWESRKEIASLNMTKSAIFDIASYNSDIIVADGSGLVTIIDAKALKVKHRINHSEKSARTIAVNADKHEVAIGYSDNVIRIYNLHNYNLIHEIKGHKNSIFTVRYTPDNQLLLSAGRDAHLKAWDAGSGYLELHDIVAHMYAINHIEFSPDGKHFVTCSMDKSIKVWNTSEFKLLKVIDKVRHAGHGTSVNKLYWSNHENMLVSASDDRTISVWDLEFNN